MNRRPNEVSLETPKPFDQAARGKRDPAPDDHRDRKRMRSISIDRHSARDDRERVIVTGNAMI